MCLFVCFLHFLLLLLWCYVLFHIFKINLFIVGRWPINSLKCSDFSILFHYGHIYVCAVCVCPFWMISKKFRVCVYVCMFYSTIRRPRSPQRFVFQIVRHNDIFGYSLHILFHISIFYCVCIIVVAINVVVVDFVVV